MERIYLVRHGQDEDNANGILNGHHDTPLTEIGRQQAQDLSDKIKSSNINIDLILTSPLKRAVETAEIISRGLNLPQPIIELLLIERNFGSMTGKTHADILPMCSPNIIHGPKFVNFLNPPGAETFPDLIKRAKKLLEKINSNYQNKDILLVSHGDFGKMIYTAFYDLNWQEILKTFHFGNSDMIKLSHDIDPQKAIILEFKQYNV